MLYLSGVILAFFLSFLLLTKRNKVSADYILFAWLVITGLQLFSFYIFFSKQYFDFPSMVVFGFSLPLAQGPFLYLYTYQQTSSIGFNKKQLLHFLPLVLSYILFTGFFLLPFEQKVDVIINKGKGFELPLIGGRYAIYLSGVVYVVLSFTRLLKYRKNLVHHFSNIEKINFNWLLYLIIWMSVIWTVVLITHSDNLIYGAAAIFVAWIGYFGIRQVQVFGHNHGQQIATVFPGKKIEEESVNKEKDFEKTYEARITPVVNQISNNIKYQNSPLTESDVITIYDRLKLLMFEKKPFKNPELTLDELAQDLEVHPNHLSQVINSKEHKNFYDLVNEKRVEEFKLLVSKSSNKKFTLMAVAFDCGFNSKATFNRNFKKYTGLTPSDYLKKQAEN